MKNIVNIVLIAATVTSLTACLKDNNVNLDASKTPSVVEWSTTSGDIPAGTNSSGFTMYTRSYDAAPSAPATFTVNYAGAEAAPEDITVGLGVNSNAVTAFNAATSPVGSYVILPANLYSIPATVVIPKGQRKATVTVQVKTDQFDFTKKYLLPIAITSTTSGQVSGNFGTILISIAAKNKYDGVYSLKGNITRNTSTGPDLSLSGSYVAGLESNVVTLGLNQNSFGQFWATGGGVAGIDGLNLVVNPTTNKVTVSATGNATLKNTAGYDSRYDPATKTFYLAFNWGTAPNTRVAVDTLVYLRSR